jgi:hypothetical protein
MRSFVRMKRLSIQSSDVTKPNDYNMLRVGEKSEDGSWLQLCRTAARAAFSFKRAVDAKAFTQEQLPSVIKNVMLSAAKHPRRLPWPARFGACLYEDLPRRPVFKRPGILRSLRELRMTLRDMEELLHLDAFGLTASRLTFR